MQRKAQRRAALLEAGLELLGTQGWAATTMRAVCRKAGLNDRYFYENFTDMDALLLTIVDDLAAQGTATILTVSGSAPRRLPARTRAVVIAVLDFLTEDPRRAHILAHEFPANSLLQQRRREITKALVNIFTAQAHDLLDDISVSDTDLELTALTVIAGLWEVITTWLQGDLETSRDHLVDYVVAFLLTTTDLTSTLQRQLR